MAMDEQKKEFPMWVIWALIPLAIVLLMEYMRDFK